MSAKLNQLAVSFCAQNEILLTPEGEAALRPDLKVRAYFDTLLAEENYADARRVLAQAMPRRHALWWGLLCAWEVTRPCPPENVQEVLRSVARFVFQPSEENRRLVEQSAQLVRFESMSHMLAQAAFLSQGSMNDPDLPAVQPRPFLTGRLVGVVVYLCSVAREPIKYRQRLAEYIKVGLEVARSPRPWEEKTFAPADALTRTTASEPISV